ncbi:tubulin polyglutamylase TTLL4-like isoform X1 [Cimex lectularius]|uniref:Tubulin polyglutamylase TTLL4-like n=1 Tax=Cimex lectularius TaxID=79782 RepID=A0A8I6RRI8_CIMLE|nr:tubulin polyglutamylase TTLL4-like isoform X1 [Cimex lectularius]XP_014250186.1 tubulin polyglutamylase TTLL4-like isoform X1 [Cimex lectularius]XP_024084529.1 tubulin polyglutamylase TTLL4-like isoform X1 [Cimex lectularius]XP_024084530.1 tubulin polyglutamylase TTLL4-like isoform X1 [Cimex lectularius]
MASPYIVPKITISNPKDCKSCSNSTTNLPSSPLKHRIGTCGFSCTEWCSVCEDQLKSGFKDQAGNVGYSDRPYSDVLRLQNSNRNDKKTRLVNSLEKMEFDYEGSADSEKGTAGRKTCKQEMEKIGNGDVYWSYPRCGNNISTKQWTPNRVHEKYLKEVEALRGKLRELRGASSRKLPATPSEPELSLLKKQSSPPRHTFRNPYITQNDLKQAEKVSQLPDTKRNRHSSERESTIHTNFSAASKRPRDKSPPMSKLSGDANFKATRHVSIKEKHASYKSELNPMPKQAPPVPEDEQPTKSESPPQVSEESIPVKVRAFPKAVDASTSCTEVKPKSSQQSPAKLVQTPKPSVIKKGRSLSYTIGATYAIPAVEDFASPYSLVTPSYAVGDTLEQISLEEKSLKNVITASPSLQSESQPFIRPSLFPHVPPYLRFISHDAKAPTIPKLIQRSLKWKLSTITPLVVRHTVQNSGFKLVRSTGTNDWLGIWGRHMKSICFKTLKDYQKINHIPGTFQIGRKDRLWKNLFRLMSKFGKKEFGFIPRTFILPQDMKLLRQAWDRTGSKAKWIVKPPASARGTGIKVVHKWGQIPKKVPVIVQKYISNPYLINGNKFDLRLYVLVPTFNPLRIYLYENGLVRFASVKYSDEPSTLNNRYMHLTNYSINKLSNNYAQNEDAEACTGHKWTIKSLWTYLEGSVNMDALWTSLEELVIKTMISGESSISQLSNSNLTSRYCSYELFGVDVLLDENLRPWLLEVNISPSLHSSSPLDLAVKGPMVKDLLNIAGFQIPNKLTQAQQDELSKRFGIEGKLCYDHRLFVNGLSPAEKSKQLFFDKVEDREYYKDSILTDLTPDDIRHLVIYEDELTQIGQFQKVFPTERTHTFLQYFEGNRYYNYLFDAWESRYHNNRTEGIKLLELKCREQIHLDVTCVEPRNSTPYSSDNPNANENPLDESQSVAHHSGSPSEETTVRLGYKYGRSRVRRMLSSKCGYARFHKKKVWAAVK